MNKVINLSPEAVELLNQLCEPENLEDNISVLDAAEEQLQQLASGERETNAGYSLYDLAYQVKSIRKDMMKLKTEIENGREEG